MRDESFKKMKDILDTSTVYHYIGRKDRHLINIFHWMKTLENLADEVAESEMDRELEADLRGIIARLKFETGQRMCAIMSDIIGDDSPRRCKKPQELLEEPPLLRSFPKK